MRKPISESYGNEWLTFMCNNENNLVMKSQKLMAGVENKYNYVKASYFEKLAVLT